MPTSSKAPTDFRSIKSYIVLKQLNTEVMSLASSIQHPLTYIANSIKLAALSAMTLLSEGSVLETTDFLTCAIDSKAEIARIDSCIDLIESQQTDSDRLLDTSTVRLLIKDANKQLTTLIKKLKAL